MDKTISEWMEEWGKETQKPDFSEIQDGMSESLRSELIAHGIDPDSVYPIDIAGSHSTLDPNEPIEVTVKFVPIPPVWKDT